MIKNTYFLFAFLCLSSFCFAEVQKQEQQKIRFNIEMVNEETVPFGLKKENVYADVMTKLIQSQIFIQEEQKNPQLILRIKTLETETQVVAFVQLGFSEEATLTRNNSDIWAMTWSQATLLSAAKAEFSQACQKTILQMVGSFATEFQKAFVAPKIVNPPQQ